MATYNMEEQEKLDRMKSWWEKHGTSVIVVVSVFVAGIVGTQGWKHYQQQQRAQAADLYVLLQQVVESEDPERINDAAHLLMEGFSTSGYASRAAMIAARANFGTGDINTAKENLQWVLDNAEEEELKDLVRLRMAGLLLDEENYDDALKLLDSKHGSTFVGLYADRKGDVLAAVGKVADAQHTYHTAIDMLGKNNNYYNIVQMKLDALGETDIP